jgi:hypothetical protein
MSKICQEGRKNHTLNKLIIGRHYYILSANTEINGQNRPGLHVNSTLFDFIDPVLFEQQSYADTAPDGGIQTA